MVAKRGKHLTAGPKYRCKLCNDVIQSQHQHDFKWCKCKAMAIDGGNSYTKLMGNIENMEKVE